MTTTTTAGTVTNNPAGVAPPTTLRPSSPSTNYSPSLSPDNRTPLYSDLPSRHSSLKPQRPNMKTICLLVHQSNKADLSQRTLPRRLMSSVLDGRIYTPSPQIPGCKPSSRPITAPKETTKHVSDYKIYSVRVSTPSTRITVTP